MLLPSCHSFYKCLRILKPVAVLLKSAASEVRNFTENKKYHIPARRSASVRARGPVNTRLVFDEDGLFLNILSIEKDDAKSIMPV